MTGLLDKVERNLVFLAPIIIGTIIYPGYTPVEVFAAPKIYALCIILFVLNMLRLLINFKTLTIANMARSVASLRNISVLIVIVSILISIFISINPDYSAFGNMNLMTGGVFFIICLLSFWTFSQTKYCGIYLKSFLVTSMVISILVIVEFLGFRPLNPIAQANYTLHSVYPGATAGYKGHLAGLLSFLGFIPILYFRSSIHSPKFYICFFLSTVALACTTNTSAYVAFLAAMLLYIILTDSRTRVAVVLTVGLSFLCLPILNYTGNYLESVNIVSSRTRTKNIEDATSFRTRVLLWKAAYQLFKDRPIEGWGIQTYRDLWFNSLSKADADELIRLELNLKPSQGVVRREDVAGIIRGGKTDSGTQLIYLSSHNSFLDIIYAQGLIGLASCLIFFFSWLHIFFQREYIIYLLPMISFAVYLQAWFPTATNLCLFTILAGICFSATRTGLSHKN